MGKRIRLRARRQILQNFVEPKQFFQVKKLVYSYLLALNQTNDQTNVKKIFTSFKNSNFLMKGIYHTALKASWDCFNFNTLEEEGLIPI